jgi:hypothetical protein
MKKTLLSLILLLFLISCKEAVKDSSSQNQTFGNSTEYTRLSEDRIDGSRTFELIFTLDKPADCMTIDIESVFVQKSFPIERVPKKTFFIIEKKLNLPQFNLKKNNLYISMGRNFNNDWDLYSPVKICGSKSDPISNLDLSQFRIRFSTFEKTDFYYVITITCESKVMFVEYTPPSKK